MMGMSQDNNVLIPLNLAKGIFDVENQRYNPQVTVRGKENVNFEDVESELKGLMRSIRRLQPGEEDNFSLKNEYHWYTKISWGKKLFYFIAIYFRICCALYFGRIVGIRSCLYFNFNSHLWF